jgi:hypothetical protein
MYNVLYIFVSSHLRQMAPWAIPDFQALYMSKLSYLEYFILDSSIDKEKIFYALR